MNLFVDIGNTASKIGYKNKNGEWKTVIFKTDKKILTYDYCLPLKNYLKKVNINFKEVWISSVVPTITPSIKSFFVKKNFQVKVLNSNTKYNFAIKTKNPKQLGTDIVANNAYVANKFKNVIVISFGTATVISHMKEQTLLGVVICPGVTTGLNSLIANASKLSNTELNYVSGYLGKDTEEAIYIGVIKSHSLMVESLINKIDKNAEIIITGGNYAIFKEIIKFKHQYIPEMVLKGLKELASKN